MNHLTDQQLLNEYAGSGSEFAFAELVRRQVGLVYSAALRMVRDAHLAEDVTQGVFLALAKNAAQLTDRPVLSGWLHGTAQNIAAQAVRTDVRRRAREQEAAMQTLTPETDAPWKQIAPELDAALGQLNDADRDALLLRYFEGKSARDMAQLLGINDEAAQKRVTRAVDRLREVLVKNGVTVGASGLVILISANAVHAAPAGLNATILSAMIEATKTTGMTMLQKLLITGMTAVLIGAGLFTVHSQTQMRALEQQQAALTRQIEQLTHERDTARNDLAALRQTDTGTLAQNTELLSLRNEVTLLRNQIKGAPANVAATTNVNAWADWNNHQTLGSFYAIAGTTRETVAVGVDGRIATRDNASGVWKVQTFVGDPDFRAIVYANNQYVVVREGGAIMTSPDGLTWMERTSPTKENLLGLYWDGHQYLAGGDKGTVISSPDGVDWTSRNSGNEINLSGFSYSGSRYVAVGNDGILTSSDAITWTPVTAAPQAVPFTACTWTGTEFLACGLGLGKNPTIYTSPDGDVWTQRDTNVTASLRSAITVNGATYILGDSVIEKTTDGGATWTNTFSSSQGNNLFMGLTSNGESLIAAGFNHNVWAMPLSAGQ